MARGARVNRPRWRSPAATTPSTTAVSHSSCSTFARTISRRAILTRSGPGCAGTLVPARADLDGRGRRWRWLSHGGSWSRGWGRAWGLVSGQGEGQRGSRSGSHGRLQVARAWCGRERHGQRRWLEHGRLRRGRRRGWWRGWVLRRWRRRQQLLRAGRPGAHSLAIGGRREDEHRRRQQGGCGPPGPGSWMHLPWRRQRGAPGP